MMGPEVVTTSFAKHGTVGGLNLIEGNRGLLDGVDASGTHSSASLGRLLDCPVVLVLSPVKVTATAAATVLGLCQLAPELEMVGVVLNQVAGPRHERTVRRAIEEYTGLTVLGSVPKLAGPMLVSRHLGLVPPAEHRPAEDLQQRLSGAVRQNLDVDRLFLAARRARPLDISSDISAGPQERSATALFKSSRADHPQKSLVRIGIFRDPAFTFYYPENLEALQKQGATLIPISALADKRLPSVDALYVGGGFPETHIAELAANGSLLAEVKEAARLGLPIYAECGGLMYLAESLKWQGRTVKLAGALPIRVQVHDRPQGHGYCKMVVEKPNPFLPVGLELRGHEFHYSSLVGGVEGLRTAYSVSKGRGCLEGRDGILQDNILASYLHLHALGCPEWAAGMIQAAIDYRDRGRAVGPARSTAA
jgi:cobyrinic acid a,c-diamide synthase